MKNTTLSLLDQVKYYEDDRNYYIRILHQIYGYVEDGPAKVIIERALKHAEKVK